MGAVRRRTRAGRAGRPDAGRVAAVGRRTQAGHAIRMAGERVRRAGPRTQAGHAIGMAGERVRRAGPRTDAGRRSGVSSPPGSATQNAAPHRCDHRDSALIEGERPQLRDAVLVPVRQPKRIVIVRMRHGVRTPLSRVEVRAWPFKLVVKVFLPDGMSERMPALVGRGVCVRDVPADGRQAVGITDKPRPQCITRSQHVHSPAARVYGSSDTRLKRLPRGAEKGRPRLCMPARIQCIA